MKMISGKSTTAIAMMGLLWMGTLGGAASAPQQTHVAWQPVDEALSSAQVEEFVALWGPRVINETWMTEYHTAPAQSAQSQAIRDEGYHDLPPPERDQLTMALATWVIDRMEQANPSPDDEAPTIEDVALLAWGLGQAVFPGDPGPAGPQADGAGAPAPVHAEPTPAARRITTVAADHAAMMEPKPALNLSTPAPPMPTVIDVDVDPGLEPPTALNRTAEAQREAHRQLAKLAATTRLIGEFQDRVDHQARPVVRAGQGAGHAVLDQLPETPATPIAREGLDNPPGLRADAIQICRQPMGGSVTCGYAAFEIPYDAGDGITATLHAPDPTQLPDALSLEFEVEHDSVSFPPNTDHVWVDLDLDLTLFPDLVPILQPIPLVNRMVRMEIGVDGAADRLAGSTHIEVTLRDFGSLADEDRNDITLGLAHDHPGAASRVTFRTYALGGGDPVYGGFKVTPVPDAFTAHIIKEEGSERDKIHFALDADGQPTTTVDVGTQKTTAPGDPITQAVVTIKNLPGHMEMDFLLQDEQFDAKYRSTSAVDIDGVIFDYPEANDPLVRTFMTFTLEGLTQELDIRGLEDHLEVEASSTTPMVAAGYWDYDNGLQSRIQMQAHALPDLLVVDFTTTTEGTLIDADGATSIPYVLVEAQQTGTAFGDVYAAAEIVGLPNEAKVFFEPVTKEVRWTATSSVSKLHAWATLLDSNGDPWSGEATAYQLPESWTFKFDPDNEIATWSGSDQMASLVIKVEGIYQGETWKVGLRLLDLPTSFEIGYNEDAPFIDALGAAFGTIEGYVTNHNTYQVGGPHQSLVANLNNLPGEIDAYFRFDGLQRVQFVSDADGMRVDVKTIDSQPLYIDVDHRSDETVTDMRAILDPLPSQFHVQQIGDKWIYEASSHFDLRLDVAYGHKDAFPGLFVAPWIDGIAVRDGGTCGLTPCDTRALHTRVQIDGFPTRLEADLATNVYTIEDYSPPTGKLGVDAKLRHTMQKVTTLIATINDIPEGLDMVIGPIEGGRDGDAWSIDGMVTTSAALGVLEAVVAWGSKGARIELSHVPPSVQFDARLEKGVGNEVNIDFSEPLERILFDFIALIDDMTIGGFIELRDVPAGDPEPLHLSWGPAGAPGSKLFVFNYDASAQTLDIEAEVTAPLFDGYGEAVSTLSIENLAPTVGVVGGRSITLTSPGKTDRFLLTAYADAARPLIDYERCLPHCGASARVELEVKIGVWATVPRLTVSMTDLKELVLDVNIISKVQGQFSEFVLHIPGMSAWGGVLAEVRFHYKSLWSFPLIGVDASVSFSAQPKFYKFSVQTSRIWETEIIVAGLLCRLPAPNFRFYVEGALTSLSTTYGVVSMSHPDDAGGQWIIGTAVTMNFGAVPVFLGIDLMKMTVLMHNWAFHGPVLHVGAGCEA